MANKLALEAGIGCRLLLKHPAVVWLVRHVAGADYQIQHWKRWMLSFQEDLWEDLPRQHLQVWRAGTLQAEWTSLESCRTAMGTGSLGW